MPLMLDARNSVDGEIMMNDDSSRHIGWFVWNIDMLHQKMFGRLFVYMRGIIMFFTSIVKPLAAASTAIAFMVRRRVRHSDK